MAKMRTNRRCLRRAEQEDHREQHGADSFGAVHEAVGGERGGPHEGQYA